ncbi:NACHT domain-containing protein [Streptomyces sp. NPDC047046]|uniref:NACHT domain-containing protein n=1 Tax=Streptomyces sp. NPDC047046 TaxID=3155378 RepID=UPI0033C7970C
MRRARQQVKNVQAGRDIVLHQTVLPGSGRHELDEAAARLRDVLRASLGREISRRSLSHPEPIGVRWATTARPVATAAEVLGDGPEVRHGTVEDIPRVFRELPLRHLVILGDPGSGKSSLALLLAFHLLKSDRKGDPPGETSREPVPLLLPAVTWSPDVALREWLGGQLAALLPRRRDRALADRLVETGRVFPVIDGLDEIPQERGERLIRTLDQDLGDDMPLVVTCRGEEYTALVARGGERLTRASVVELEPVGTESARRYLRRAAVAGDTRWDPLLDALRERPQGPPATAFRSPLLLFLARTVYAPSGTDPGELLDEAAFPDARAIEERLLGAYIPTLYGRDSAGHRTWGPGKAERYLRTLAADLGSRRATELAVWKLLSPWTLLVPAAGVAVLSFLVTGHLVGSDVAVPSVVFVLCLLLPVLFVAYAFMREARSNESGLRDMRSALRLFRWSAFLSSGVMAVLVGGLLAWVCRASLAYPAASAVRAGVRMGTYTALLVLTSSLWFSHRLTHLAGALSGRLPWRLTRFVDDATDRGVLRASGTDSRQFRHVLLQHHLAPGSADPPEPSPLPPSRRSGTRHPVTVALFSSAVLAAALLMSLAIPPLFAAGWRGATDQRAVWRGGTRPETRTEYCLGAGPDSPCTPRPYWLWDVPPHGSFRTTATIALSPGAGLEGRAFAIRTLKTRVRVLDCPDAEIVMEIRPAGQATERSAGQAAGRDTERAAGRAAAPATARLAGRSTHRTDLATPSFSATTAFSLTVRATRLDDSPCTARIEATVPVATVDRWKTLRLHPDIPLL